MKRIVKFDPRGSMKSGGRPALAIWRGGSFGRFRPTRRSPIVGVTLTTKNETTLLKKIATQDKSEPKLRTYPPKHTPKTYTPDSKAKIEHL